MMLIKQKKRDKVNFFVIIEAVICAVMIFGVVTVRSDIASSCFTLSFIVLLLEFIRKTIFKKNLDKMDWLLIWIIMMSMINVLINSAWEESTLSFQKLTPYFIFAATVILFRLSIDIELNKKTCNIIFIIQIVISAIYVYAHNFIPQTLGITSQGFLSLNFSNPNLTGMFLLQSLLFMSVGIIYYKRIYIRLFCLVLTVILFKYVTETGARNVQIAYFFFLLFSAVYFIKADFKIPKWASFALNCAPIVFVLLYLNTIEGIIESEIFSFLASDGKNIDSRVEMWNRFLFEKFDNAWITGNYTNCLGNCHNSLLVVLVSYGIIVLGLVIIFNYLITNKINAKVSNRFQGICLSAYFAVVLMGLGEGALYSGGMGLYIFPALFIMLANSDIVNEQT